MGNHQSPEAAIAAQIAQFRAELEQRPTNLHAVARLAWLATNDPDHRTWLPTYERRLREASAPVKPPTSGTPPASPTAECVAQDHGASVSPSSFGAPAAVGAESPPEATHALPEELLTSYDAAAQAALTECWNTVSPWPEIWDLHWCPLPYRTHPIERAAHALRHGEGAAYLHAIRPDGAIEPYYLIPVPASRAVLGGALEFARTSQAAGCRVILHRAERPRPGDLDGRSRRATLLVNGEEVIAALGRLLAGPLDGDSPPLATGGNMPLAGEAAPSEPNPARPLVGEQERTDATGPDRRDGNSAHCAYSAGGGTDPWDPPIPLDTITVPAFPLDALPPPLREYVENIARVHKVPVDLPAMSALGTVGAAAARRVEVQIGNTHREPLNFYVAGVAGSGERKKVALQPIEPLRDVERELQETALPLVTAARERRQLAEVRLKHLREEAAKAKDPHERQQIEHEAEELAQQLPEVPVLPKLLVSNTTPEKLEELLAEQDGAICMASEEAGSVFEIAAGRYAKDGGSQLDTLLLAYDGGEIDTVRIMRRGAKVRRPALSIILTPQPTILQGFRAHPEFQRRGLIGRFLFVVPGSLVGTRLYETRAASKDVRLAYEATIRRVLSFAKPSDPEQIPAVKIEGAALEVWRRHHDELELAQAEGGQLVGIREWASKHAARVARIAAGLHLVTCSDPQPWSVSVSVETVERAWRIGWYLVEHALAAHDLMGSDESLDGARSVLAWIIKYKRTSFTKREVFNDLRARFKTVAALEPALGVLVSHEYIHRRPDPQRDGPGRPPSPTYDVSPYAHITQNPQNAQAAS